jgi:Rieske Fe-S protein
MSRSVYSFAIAAICASTVLASAQVKSSTTEVAPSSVAYVYVTSNPANGGGEIYGATVAANGSATLIPGSPFLFNVNYMAVNRAWLFGVANLDNSIDSFSIAANGALSLENTVAVPTGGGVISIYLDHTGSTLYADYYTTNNDFYSYSIDQSTGQLSQIGDLPGGPPDNTPMSFIGNNVYAYSSSCYHFGPEIIGVQRASSGTLTYINNFNPPFPAEKSGGIYCPWLAAADPTNHLAIAMTPLTSNWDQDGPEQLATYTADASGNFTTNSTYSNMPSVLVGGVNDYRMSPSGKYLAVGGTRGFQIFHFNGANPITPYTGLLTSTPIDQIFWDNSNHVYALSRSASEVFVYTVTSTAVTRAPGSPHKVPSAGSLIVLPK